MWILAGITAVTLLVGIPFLLWWWRMADQWVDAEQRRFGPRERVADGATRIVVRTRPEVPGRSPNEPARSEPTTPEPARSSFDSGEPKANQGRQSDLE